MWYGSLVATNLTVSVVFAPAASVSGNVGGLTSDQLLLIAYPLTVSGAVPSLLSVSVSRLWTTSPTVGLGLSR